MGNHTALTVPRAEAAEKIREQLEQGRGILALPITSRASLETADTARKLWRDLTYELLKRLFTDTSEAYGFIGSPIGFRSISRRFDPERERERFRKEHQKQLTEL